MLTLDLNSPDTRQALLLERLETGKPLVAREIADALQVSLDTIRRDLITLEKQGALKRVKGGAIRIDKKLSPMVERLKEMPDWLTKAKGIFTELLVNSPSMFLDGGTAVLFFARQIPVGYRGQIMTPSPLVATALLEKQIDVVLIGGTLRPLGGIATGAEAVRSLSKSLADVAVLGTCGLDPDFGLSADDVEEAAVKQIMSENANRVVVLASADKLNSRSAHQVVPCDDIDVLISSGSKEMTSVYNAFEIEVHNV
ncbi:DeoR/GlpR family DNA-binding transcription regulator [Kiloniella sp. EL199]|uniref:DeoR/GlpR family DNA-binding transcription regulator n=1 Tax=Kiloniella sp. EL199 TaxID=2107581 RepID=UPI000EA07A57|nr:DeoR/GlpR family DNA-binding transcription regulator [Kiloniella sp. EL199]